MTTENKLREGKNNCEIVGILKENNLKIDKLLDKNTGAPYNAIMGDIVVKVGEHDEHKVNLFSKELTKAGAESKLFKAYKTIMDNYVSMADIAKLPIEEKEGKYPTRLQVQGEIRLNDYYSNNQMNSRAEISGKFITSDIKEGVEDKAEFTVEMYLNKKKNELDKDGIETGRLEVEGILVGYNGIASPVSFKVTDEHGVSDYMKSNFDVGDSVEVWGDLVNSAIITKTLKQGFGEAKEEITATYKNEIVITGGEERVLNETKAFNPDLIQKALAEREIYLAEKEEETKSKANKPQQRNKGFGGKVGETPIPPKKIKTEDIPF